MRGMREGRGEGGGWWSADGQQSEVEAPLSSSVAVWAPARPCFAIALRVVASAMNSVGAGRPCRASMKPKRSTQCTGDTSQRGSAEVNFNWSGIVYFA